MSVRIKRQEIKQVKGIGPKKNPFIDQGGNWEAISIRDKKLTYDPMKGGLNRRIEKGTRK